MVRQLSLQGLVMRGVIPYTCTLPKGKKLLDNSFLKLTKKKWLSKKDLILIFVIIQSFHLRFCANGRPWILWKRLQTPCQRKNEQCKETGRKVNVAMWLLPDIFQASWNILSCTPPQLKKMYYHPGNSSFPKDTTSINLSFEKHKYRLIIKFSNVLE